MGIRRGFLDGVCDGYVFGIDAAFILIHPGAKAWATG
jgi:hypothetical protein